MKPSIKWRVLRGLSYLEVWYVAHSAQEKIWSKQVLHFLLLALAKPANMDLQALTFHFVLHEHSATHFQFFEPNS